MGRKNRSAVCLLVSVALLMLGHSARADDPHKSVVFKNFRIPPPTFVRRSHDLSSEFWQEFQLVQQANAGDPVAEHELGLRYLMGDGFMPDTAKAVYWVKKAADQKFPLADYNYGIFLNNGVGVPWNPFEAYQHFRLAAARQIPQAEYMVGVYLSDELALPRNLPEAFRFFKAAADSGFQPAREVLREFTERGWDKISDSVNEKHSASHDASGKDSTKGTIRVVSGIGSATSNLSTDTIPLPDARKLLEEAISGGMGDEFDTTRIDTESFSDSTVARVKTAAEWGSPEALTLLGYCYEHGIRVAKDRTRAAVCYLGAMRLDSPRAPFILYRLIHEEGYFDALRRRVDQEDAEAEYVWAGLIAYGLDAQLTEKQALELLVKSADHHFVEAVVELALCYHSGKWVKQDRRRSRQLFQDAVSMGSEEARLRLLMADKLAGRKNLEDPVFLDRLFAASKKGSVLAQEILGYCYEKGLLVGKSRPEAVRYYRLAAQRGSLVAYNALKELYNEIRPAGEEFRMVE